MWGEKLILLMALQFIFLLCVDFQMKFKFVRITPSKYTNKKRSLMCDEIRIIFSKSTVILRKKLLFLKIPLGSFP